MSLSKIIRNISAAQCQTVVMANLDEVTQVSAGGFVVLDSSSFVETSSPKVESPVPDQSHSAEHPVAHNLKQVQQECEEKGYQRGLEDGEAQFGKATKALVAACSEMHSLKEKMLQRSSEDMLRLVLAIAERIIQTEMTLNNKIIVKTVQQAIQVAVNAEEFRIKVHPDDLQVVQEHKPLFIASLSGLSNIEFVADPTLARGGCMLESALGRVDATIEAQMEAITSCLQKAIGVA
jgi:flagellar assembly protein FliH